MFFSSHLSAAVAVLVLAFLLSWSLRAEKERQHGYKAPLRYPHLDPLLGLDLKFQEIRNTLKFRRLPTTAGLFRQIGPTFRVNNFGGTMIRTIDAENIHTVESLKERDWAIEPLRLRVMQPFCGRGFITTEGVTWKRSRALL